MAQYNSRINLQAATFPLLSQQSGRTIIAPQYDQTYVPGVNADGGAPVDKGIPGIVYAHNVMPTSYGYQSVDYDDRIPAAENPLSAVFSDALLISSAVKTEVPPPEDDPEADPTITTSAGGFQTYVALTGPGLGQLWVISPSTKTWIRPEGSEDIKVPVGATLSVATVNGISYIYVSNVGCYIYYHATDGSYDSFGSVELVGLEPTTTLGLVASNGFLIAYSSSGVAWSSTVDITDFTPSDVSDAGGGQIQEAKSDIICCRRNALGFIIYTKANAVSAAFSGNNDFPWIFKEVPSSGGLLDIFQVGQDTIGEYQHAFTTKGVQRISFAGGNTVLPQITDFLAGKIFEDFDTATNTIKVTRLTPTQILNKKVATAADRYLVFSYGLPEVAGPEPFTHAIIVDTVQSRYGKLKISHSGALDFTILFDEVIEVPRQTIGFIDSTGKIQTVNFVFNEEAGDAVMILGKFQFIRTRMMQLEKVELETSGAFDITMYNLPALNGKDFGTPVLGYLMESSEEFKSYNFDSVATNHSLLIKGTFNITTIIPWFSLHGRY